MKKTNNYWMAVLVFVLTMVLLYGGTLFISLVAAVGGAVMGGDRALDLVERFIMENQNLLSCQVRYSLRGTISHLLKRGASGRLWLPTQGV